MSHGVHSTTHGSHDSHGAHRERPLPASSATTLGVKLLVLAGLLASIMQGSFTVASSGFGRIWPAADVVKIQLPPSHF